MKPVKVNPPMPFRLHTFWEGDMPSKVKTWMDTVRSKNLGWHLDVWNLSNIEQLGLNPKTVLDEYGSWAGVSNAVRILALNRYGGIWLDADCECVKPLKPLLQYEAFAAIQDFEPMGKAEGRINPAVFGCVPGHPWIRWQAENLDRYKSKDPVWVVWIASEAPRDGLTIIPTHWVFPFLWIDPPEKRVAHAESFIIHHWLGSWA